MKSIQNLPLKISNALDALLIRQLDPHLSDEFTLFAKFLIASEWVRFRITRLNDVAHEGSPFSLDWTHLGSITFKQDQIISTLKQAAEGNVIEYLMGENGVAALVHQPNVVDHLALMFGSEQMTQARLTADIDASTAIRGTKGVNALMLRFNMRPGD